MANDRYSKAIKDTLSYKAVFKSSVNKYQLYTYLITDKELDPEELKEAFEKMVEKNEVKSRKNLYYAPGYRPLNWQERYNRSKKLLKENNYVFKVLEQIPWIKLLCVTGSVAAINPDKDADIDIFIVTQKNRTWITRAFVVIILKILDKYRTDANPKNKICPNIYVDEDNMIWEKDKQSVYVATEILLAYPIINKENCYFKFVDQNKWVFDYYKNFHIETIPYSGAKKDTSPAINILEKIARKAQISYQKTKQTTEILSSGFIHFNRDDWGPKILKKYDSLKKNFK